MAAARRLLALHRTFAKSLSTTSSPCMVVAPPPPDKIFTKSESRDFMSVFPDLVRELTHDGPYKGLPIIAKHLTKSLQYNVPGGKKNRGLAVPTTYKLLRPDHTPDQMSKAHVLGWCVELLQAFFLVADDIMDGSPTRRGQPSWHVKEDVGLAAFNDSLLLEAAIYNILERHFHHMDCYPALLQEFHTASSHTCVGQCLDLLTAQQRTPEGRPDLDAFDMERYKAIVKYKTSYYSFALPVALGMRLAGIDEQRLHQLAQKILLEMGHFFQAQDDFLDCFGDPAVTGKDGTDIADGKCSWMIVVAMQRANKEQRQVLKACYGSSFPADIACVKAVYEELNLAKIFKTYEEDSYQDLVTHIAQLPGAGEMIPQPVFTTFLDRIYKRKV